MAAGGEGAQVWGVLRCELGGATLLLRSPDENNTQLDVWRVDGSGRSSGKPLRSLAKAGHEIKCFAKLEGDVAATGGDDGEVRAIACARFSIALLTAAPFADRPVEPQERPRDQRAA